MLIENDISNSSYEPIKKNDVIESDEINGKNEPIIHV